MKEPVINFDNIDWKFIGDEQPTEFSDDGYLLKTYNNSSGIGSDGKRRFLLTGTCRIYRGGISPWVGFAWKNELLWTDEVAQWPATLAEKVGDKFIGVHIGPILTHWYKINVIKDLKNVQT